MIRNILFDWSGTLVDDLGAVLGTTNRVLQAYGLATLEEDEFRRRFQLPFVHFYDEVAPGVALNKLEETYEEHFPDFQHLVELLPHSKAFLDFCRARGFRLFVVSAIHPEHYAEQSARLEVDHYFEAAYVGVRDKREEVGRILQDHGLAPEETLLAGDMRHDVETAKGAGLLAVATLTGYEPVERLVAAGADITVRDLAALRRSLEREAPLESMPVATVGALIFRGDDEVLLIKTHKWANRWGIPGGKIRRGETSEDALRREILEETALEIGEIDFVFVQDCIEPEEFMRSAHFLLMNYTARAEGGEVVLNEEAEEFRWVSLEESLAMDLNQPTRRLIEEVMRRNVYAISEDS